MTVIFTSQRPQRKDGKKETTTKAKTLLPLSGPLDLFYTSYKLGHNLWGETLRNRVSEAGTVELEADWEFL